MVNELNVELYGQLIGTISPGNRAGAVTLRTSQSGMMHFIDNLRIMSESIPLTYPLPIKRRDNVDAFMKGLLPEGNILNGIVTRAGTRVKSSDDTYGLLKYTGLETAGALRIYDPDDPSPTPEQFVSPADGVMIAQLLSYSAEEMPLGNDVRSGKSALAGYQKKIVLASIDGVWNRCHFGYPSTHILKPVSEKFPDMIYNEAYALSLARRVGLTTFKSEIITFNGIDALVIERYDREVREGLITRIHQEDSAQALGVQPRLKYQKDGGQIRLLRVAEITERNAPDGSQTEILLAQTTTNLAVGNLDAHAKNISFIHALRGPTKLSPLYDLVPMVHYPGPDQDMSLAINKKYHHASIGTADLINEGVSWGLNHERASRVVHDTLENLSDAISDVEPNANVPDRVVNDISRFTNGLVRRGSISDKSVKINVPFSAQEKIRERCGVFIESAGAFCILKPLHGGNHRSKL